jgi:hypothetical protein
MFLLDIFFFLNLNIKISKQNLLPLAKKHHYAFPITIVKKIVINLQTC